MIASETPLLNIVVLIVSRHTYSSFTNKRKLRYSYFLLIHIQSLTLSILYPRHPLVCQKMWLIKFVICLQPFELSNDCGLVSNKMALFICFGGHTKYYML